MKKMVEIPKIEFELTPKQIMRMVRAQIDEKTIASIFGNAGTIISFRIGARDAEYLAREFYPDFRIEDFVNLPAYHIYLRLMIDGVVSNPFSAVTFMA
jgi:hypothetical protein